MASVVSITGATVLTHEGVTYEANADGVFDLPEHVFHAVGRLNDLVTSAEHEARLAAERLAADLAPERLHERLSALEETVAGLLKPKPVKAKA